MFFVIIIIYFFDKAIPARFNILKSNNIISEKGVPNYKVSYTCNFPRKTFFLNNNSFSWLEIFAKKGIF